MEGSTGPVEDLIRTLVASKSDSWRVRIGGGGYRGERSRSAQAYCSGL